MVPYHVSTNAAPTPGSYSQNMHWPEPIYNDLACERREALGTKLSNLGQGSNTVSWIRNFVH